MVNNLGEALDIYEKITKSNNANVLDYYNYANLLPKESKLAKEALSELKSEQPVIKEESLDPKEEPLELNKEAE